MDRKYQTLPEWVNNPFGRYEHVKNSEYDKKYREYMSSNRIKIAGYCEVDGAYFVHITVPSESNDGYLYDVVLRFFTTSKEVERDSSLLRYWIQFYSNSPGFIYKYAVLYKQKGFLIESLYKMMDQNYANKLPEKTNAEMKVSYDKTIYFACKYLSDNKFKALHKRGAVLTLKKKKPTDFFRDIKGFERVKSDHEFINLEKKFQKELEKSNAKKSLLPKKKEPDPTKINGIQKKRPSKSIIGKDSSHSITYAKRVGRVSGKGKKVATKSTRRPS